MSRRKTKGKWWIRWSPAAREAFALVWNRSTSVEEAGRAFALSRREAAQRARILRHDFGMGLKDMRDELRIYAPGCAVPGCTRPRPNRVGGAGQGMCSTHYMRWRRGDRGERLARPVQLHRPAEKPAARSAA